MRNQHQRAQALVEFALILPVLILILMAVFDGGRAVYAYNAVSNAAREGGRTAIINQDTQLIRQRAAQQATALGLPDTDPGDCPAAGGTTATAAGICVVFRSGDTTAPCLTPDIGCTAIVAVKYDYTFITLFVGDFFGPMMLSATTRQVIENRCPRPNVLASNCLTR